MKQYERIRELRENHDLTQAKIGAIIGVSQRTYAHYEVGDRMIPPEITMSAWIIFWEERIKCRVGF